MRRIAIALALDPEWRAVARRLQGLGHEPVAGREVHTGQLGGTTVALFVTGPGPAAAEAAAQALLPGLGAACLVAAGFGGGLSAAVRHADVVVAEGIIGPAAGPALACDARMLAAAPALVGSGCRVHRGMLASVAAVVATPNDKAELAQSSGAMAVDMESGALGSAAAALGVPFLAVRAITDTAADRLPLDLSACIRPDGSVRPALVASALLRRPHAISGLIGLAAHSARAGRTLAAFLEAFCPRLAALLERAPAQ